ncbi:MAG: hypothetical protein VW307_01825, partial [Alphaproteobacteria bacterium]
KCRNTRKTESRIQRIGPRILMIAIGEITMVIIGHDTSFRQNPFYTLDNWDMLVTPWTSSAEEQCGIQLE